MSCSTSFKKTAEEMQDTESLQDDDTWGTDDLRNTCGFLDIFKGSFVNSSGNVNAGNVKELSVSSDFVDVFKESEKTEEKTVTESSRKKDTTAKRFPIGYTKYHLNEIDRDKECCYYGLADMFGCFLQALV